MFLLIALLDAMKDQSAARAQNGCELKHRNALSRVVEYAEGVDGFLEPLRKFL